MASIADELNSLFNTSGSNIAEAIDEFRRSSAGFIEVVKIASPSETLFIL